MKKLIFIRFVSLFLAVLVLGSSIGIVINNHYCASTKTLKQSFFGGKINCDHKHQTTHSCKKSCQNACHSHENKTHIEITNCCVDYAVFLRIEEASNVSDLSNQIANHFLPVLHYFDFLGILNNGDLKFETFIKQPPPFSLFWGKEKVIAFSQLKIDNLFL